MSETQTPPSSNYPTSAKWVIATLAVLCVVLAGTVVVLLIGDDKSAEERRHELQVACLEAGGTWDFTVPGASACMQ